MRRKRIHGRKRRSPAKFGGAALGQMERRESRATESAEAEVETIQQAQQMVNQTDQGGDGQHTHGGDGQIQQEVQVQQEDALTQPFQHQQSTFPTVDLGSSLPTATTTTQAPQQTVGGLFGGSGDGLTLGTGDMQTTTQATQQGGEGLFGIRGGTGGIKNQTRPKRQTGGGFASLFSGKKKNFLSGFFK